MKLDTKFYGVLHKTKDDSVVPPDRYVVFLASDDAFPAALHAYKLELMRRAADQRQLDGVDDLIARVQAWRIAHRDACHVADVGEGEEV